MASSVVVQELLINTLNLLEWRLRRMEFALNGTVNNAQTPKQEQALSSASTIIARVRKLEHSLQQIALKSDVVSDLIKLQSRHPEIFANESLSDQRSEPDTTQKLSMVLSEAPAYSEVASQLRHLSDLSIPPTDAFAKLVTLQPRMANIQRRQYQQAMEMSDLRRRSGALVLRWHEVFILGQGRCWADWDTRLRRAERAVKREEVRRSQDG